MFDNHTAPSIPPRAAPRVALPANLGRAVAVAALLCLPLMLTALMGAAQPLTVLLLGLGQPLLITLVILLIRDVGAPASGGTAAGASYQQGLTHG